MNPPPFVPTCLPVCTIQEEGSWDEDGRGGGMLPRPFVMWGWTMEELAAYTTIRQLLLVPEKLFDPVNKPAACYSMPCTFDG